QHTTPGGASPVDHDAVLLAIGQTVSELISRHQALDLGEVSTTHEQRDAEMARSHRQAVALLGAAAELEARTLGAALVQLRALADWGTTLECEGEVTGEERDQFYRLLNSITGAVERATGLDRAYCGGKHFLPPCARNLDPTD
ncbi:MAG: hypothetical protein R3310_16250, partial [Candidatus Competibacteraceae bacterium]|nr:hypothetical protein [Candidatus Competibacteraceae bacterium]